jgi:hypothetical protein
MGSNPIIGSLDNAILLGELVRIQGFVHCEQSRTKTREDTVYPSSICQVQSIVGKSGWLRSFRSKKRLFSATSDGTRRTKNPEVQCEYLAVR